MNKIIFKEVEEVSFSTRGIQGGKVTSSFFPLHRLSNKKRLQESRFNSPRLFLLSFFFFFFLVQYLKSLKFEIVNNNIERNNEDPIKEKWTT